MTVRYDSFPRYVGLSVLLHIFVLVFFTVRMVFFPAEPIRIENAIRVDVVDLPDKVAATPPAPQVAPSRPEPVAVPPPSPSKAPVMEKKAETKPADVQKRALERLKALKAIDQLKTEAEAKPQPAKPQVYKGNAISRGEDLTGMERLQYNEYFGKLKNRVKENWDLPSWLSQLALKAEVVVQLDSSGKIVRRYILTSSGNEIFDSKVLASIDRGAPYPEPPNRLAGFIESSGIVFAFP